ncbi:MAG: hypothetical protein ABFS56_06325 [Pseudomonadota bacterium]
MALDWGEDIRNIFKRTQTKVVNKTLTKLNAYYEHFAQRATKSFYDVLSYEFEPEYYIDGDILTVPISGSEERIDVARDLLNATEQIVRNEEETRARDSFRDVLGYYLYSLYQLNGKLPLDGGYESFPFLLFRCDNFIATRQQQFDRRYLFSSTGFNLINLILSQTRE